MSSPNSPGVGPGGPGGYGTPPSSTSPSNFGPPTGTAPRTATAGSPPVRGRASSPAGADKRGGTKVGPARRRSRLVIRRLDPWSVMKFSLVFSLCLMVVVVVAIMALYLALQSLGVFDEINTALEELTADSEGTGGTTLAFTPARVFVGSIVVGVVNAIAITATSTLGAFLYNLVSDIVGGVEVTLAERGK